MRDRATSRSQQYDQSLPPQTGTVPNRDTARPGDQRDQANVDEDNDRDDRSYNRGYDRSPYQDRYSGDRRYSEDRRYDRAPDPYETNPYRRRPADPNQDMNPDDEDNDYYDRPFPPPSPIWRRRWW